MSLMTRPTRAIRAVPGTKLKITFVADPWGMRTALLATLLMSGCGGGSGSDTAAWDEAAAQDAREQVQRTMSAFAAMDIEGLTSALADDAIAFEMDLENKPVRLASRDEAQRFAESLFGELKTRGAALTLDVQGTSCRATSTLAYCTVEFDAKVRMGPGSEMVQPTRNSIVLRKGPEGWKWTHWHSSLAVLPSPPAGKP